MIILDRARIVGLEIKVQGDDSMKFFVTAHHAHTDDLPFSRACGFCNGEPIKTSEFEVSETDWGVMENALRFCRQTVEVSLFVTGVGIAFQTEFATLEQKAGAAGSDVIDGANTYVLDANYEAVTFYSDGVSKWFTC